MSSSSFKILVLASGGGTNFQAIIDAITEGFLPAKISALITDRDCFAQKRAEENGIPNFRLKRNKNLSQKIDEIATSKGADLIVMAGFLSIIEPSLCQNWKNKIINIHPSLLPKFGGVGMYGMKVHKAVIDNKEKESGTTVHFVTEEVDGGDIILQSKCQVEHSDTPKTLAKKIQRLEHPLLIKSILKIISYMKQALISVFDKTGIEDLAKFLEQKGYTILSTGGTFKHLEKAGIKVKEVTEITNFPEILDGRVKTLHPNVHAGILANRADSNHMKTIEQHKIAPIDIVVVNLYPFFEKFQEDISFEQKVEFIDIGGPTMLRSAAKNFSGVTVITDPEDYSTVKEEIEENGYTTLEFRKALAAKVFNLTSAYDAAISSFLSEEEFPNYLTISYSKQSELRYGENPHQKAAYYTETTTKGAMKDFEQLGGKELSFNNIRDMDMAWKVVKEFEYLACCGVKHSTPCGVALGESVFETWNRAYACDPTSIFGGIVAFNGEVDGKTAKELNSIFLEIVIAESFSDEALEIFKKKKNLRIIKVKNPVSDQHEYIKVDGGILVQNTDSIFSEDIKVMTDAKPTDNQLHELIFAQKVVKHVKSNAIVVTSNNQALGIGTGQPNRIWAAEQALSRAKEKTTGDLFLASDAFFPFSDVVELAGKYGVKGIIQPGGSIKDEDSIQKSNELGIPMVFTGMRHFKH